MLCNYSSDGFVFYSFSSDGSINPEGFPEGYYKKMIVDKNGFIWIERYENLSDSPGIPLGLFSFDPETLVSIIYDTANSGLPSDTINAIEVDRNNVKWIGTDTGVARFDGETWEVFDTENSGLVNDTVYAIAFEPDNTIWFGTENGVSVYTGDQGEWIVSVDEGCTHDTDHPSAYPTIAAYPNPFNPATTISYTLPETAAVRLDIFSVAGQKVATLVDRSMSSGTHSVVFDGTGLASGMYVYRLTAGEVVVNGKVTLVR